jgi:serine/threonine protein kinase
MTMDKHQRIGDYEVVARLGEGGMGHVYKVRNIISDRVEAMKVLLPDFATDPDLSARFMAEIRTVATLEHPGIAQLRTAFQSDGQFVMVMEYVEGTTLEKLNSGPRAHVSKIIDYASQVLEAMNYAHSKGVIHRDIKPANIIVTKTGLVKLMDFGIAKSAENMQLTRPGTTMGSVYYMSPEQVRGGTVDARSDLYSFGVTLYEMLTGRKPFEADSSYAVLNAQINQAPTPPAKFNSEISTELNNVVLRAMAKNPDERFRSAEEFQMALLSSSGPRASDEILVLNRSPEQESALPGKNEYAAGEKKQGPGAVKRFIQSLFAKGLSGSRQHTPSLPDLVEDHTISRPSGVAQMLLHKDAMESKDLANDIVPVDAGAPSDGNFTQMLAAINLNSPKTDSRNRIEGARPKVALRFIESSDLQLVDVTVPITHVPFVIGRDSDAQLSLPSNQSISKRHCVIDWIGGAYTIQDLDSTNGT